MSCISTSTLTVNCFIIFQRPRPYPYPLNIKAIISSRNFRSFNPTADGFLKGIHSAGLTQCWFRLINFFISPSIKCSMSSVSVVGPPSYVIPFSMHRARLDVALRCIHQRRIPVFGCAFAKVRLLTVLHNHSTRCILYAQYFYV